VKLAKTCASKDRTSAVTFENVSVDEVRDYWNTRPCNLRHSTAEIGARRYFERVSARKYMVEPHIRSFAICGTDAPS
jgi:predicted transcriptional regulator of viral defense system